MAAISLGVAVISFLNRSIIIDILVLNEAAYPDLLTTDYSGKLLY